MNRLRTGSAPPSLPVAVAVALLLITGCSSAPATITNEAPPPNILWITAEDINPHLGCYGFDYAVTPHLDQLAAEGVRFTHAWSTAPVCSAARTTLATGLYAPTLGAEHHRSKVRPPAFLRLFPKFLQEAGYYTSNNSKQDYNLDLPAAFKGWDVSSAKAHWRNRPPGKPFFAVFNLGISHESQVRNRIANADRIHDPATVPLPPFHPDTPASRANWAQYHDRITQMDKQAAGLLAELKEAGLTTNTIVFFFGDNGAGMPGYKRSPRNAGSHVPLMMYFPPSYAHLAPAGYEAGGTIADPVGFVDLGPTVLSLAGVKPPEWMQGRAIAGPHRRKSDGLEFAFRDRMDERWDFSRTVSDGRYVYVRNYLPYLPHGSHNAYMFETPATRAWNDLFLKGGLNDLQREFWLPKAPEELFDLQADPFETNNLARSPTHQSVLEELRADLRDWEKDTRDLSFLPEGMMLELAAANDLSPYDLGQDTRLYPLETIYETADKASLGRTSDVAFLASRLTHANAAVRYWAALGLMMHGTEAVQANQQVLGALLTDNSPYVRIAAAQAIAGAGSAEERPAALEALMTEAEQVSRSKVSAMQALCALEHAAPLPASFEKRIRTLPADDKNVENLRNRLLEVFPQLVTDEH